MLEYLIISLNITDIFLNLVLQDTAVEIHLGVFKSTDTSFTIIAPYKYAKCADCITPTR